MLSTTTPHRHSPRWLKGAKKPVFLLRAGGVVERAELEAELSGRFNAGRVFSFELLDAFASGVEKLLADDPGREELLALARREADPDGEKLTEDENRLLNQVRDVLAKHWPDYRALRERMAMRREMAPIVALRRFLVGWENVKGAFEIGPDSLVTEATLARIDPLQMLDAGHAAYQLLYPDEEALAGN